MIRTIDEKIQTELEDIKNKISAITKLNEAQQDQMLDKKTFTEEMEETKVILKQISSFLANIDLKG